MLVDFFGLDLASAERIMGSVGRGFVPAAQVVAGQPVAGSPAQAGIASP